jgi:hypothetical protein
MDFSRIEKLLKTDSEVDLQSLYKQFNASSDSPGLDRFLLYLHEHGHIESNTLTWVADAEAVSAAKIKHEEHTIVLGDPSTGDHVKIRQRGSQRDRFRVIETIGAGGMGSISLARDQNLHRYVAYKQLHSKHAAVGKAVDRFDFEAQVTAQLDHPNIVPVYSYDVGKGYAMKLIAGRTLEQVLQEAGSQRDAGKVDEDHSLAALLEIFLKVCDAIHYAHSKSVVHRDLKPQNILVGRFNEVYVVDWGIAKLLADPGVEPEEEGKDDTTVRLSDDVADAHPQTQQGDLLGTPGYMSPEQVSGDIKSFGPASDTFCLGLILYEVVNLQRAYPKSSMRKLLVNMFKAQIAPMTNRCVSGSAARELRAIITKACAHKPQDRYASTEELADDVRRFMRGEEIIARRDGFLQRIARWVGHHREATMLIVMALVLAGASGAMWTVYARQQAVIAARVHEEQVASLVTTVAERAQSIERHFLGFEAIVEGLAAAAAQLVTRGRPSAERVYTNKDLSRADGGPADFLPSNAYGKKITLDWSVFKIAPDAEEKKVSEVMAKVSPLRHHFRRTMFESVAGTAWTDNPSLVSETIRNDGTALTWAFVGFAEGVHMSYPGKGGYPPAYDPRKRPWYTHSAQNQGTAWLSPYLDASGRGLVVPCTRPLRDQSGQLLGVAGVEMTLEYLRESLLDLSGRNGIRATYLVDERGRVVASSGDTPKQFASGALVEDLAELEDYPQETVVGEIRAARSGHFTQIDNGREKVIIYQRLGSVRWYLVVEAWIDD